jgi:hypothetical protein
LTSDAERQRWVHHWLLNTYKGHLP